MRAPTISVLMPVYNAERYLALAIESVLSQTYTDFELVIVNDGSTDSSKRIISAFTDDRIRYLENEGNKGIVYTRNRLIEEAKGKYIAWLDSDDVALENRLKVQHRFLEQHPDYDICGSYAKKVDESGRVTGSIKLFSKDIDVRCNLLFTNSLITSSVMGRIETFRKNFFNPTFTVTEDYDLWCRISKIGKLKNIPKYLIHYRWHNTNISKEKQALMIEMSQRVNSRELKEIGIAMSPEELELHSSLFSKNFDNTPGDISKFKPWLQKIATYNKKAGKYSIHKMNAMIYFRWFFVLKERGLQKKVFSLRLKGTSPLCILTLIKLVLIRL